MRDFQRLFQIPLSFLEPLLPESEDGVLVETLKGPRRVFGKRMLQLLEEIPVVDDVTVLLVLAIKPVHATDRLKEPMVLHVPINVEVGRRRGVKARKKLIHHDQELHLPRLLDEVLLSIALKVLGGLPA